MKVDCRVIDNSGMEFWALEGVLGPGMEVWAPERGLDSGLLVWALGWRSRSEKVVWVQEEGLGLG